MTEDIFGDWPLLVVFNFDQQPVNDAGLEVQPWIRLVAVGDVWIEEHRPAINRMVELNFVGK